MKDIRLVDPEGLSTLEEYAAALLSSMISLKTLEQFHISAYQKGLLDKDEEETSKTICWEIRRLLALYKQQVDQVIERAPIDEAAVINSLRAQMPNVKIPRKRNIANNATQNKKKEKENA